MMCCHLVKPCLLSCFRVMYAGGSVLPGVQISTGVPCEAIAFFLGLLFNNLENRDALTSVWYDLFSFSLVTKFEPSCTQDKQHHGKELTPQLLITLKNFKQRPKRSTQHDRQHECKVWPQNCYVYFFQ